MHLGFLCTVGAKDLERKDFGGLGKSDPFMVVFADDGRSKGKYEERPPPLWRTEVIDSNSNPRWDPFPIFVDMAGGMNGRLFVECYDWDADGSMDLIGEFRCNLAQFIDQKMRHYFINPRKKSPFYKHSGSFVMFSATPIMEKAPIYANCGGYLITFQAKNLDRKDIKTLSSDPFLRIKAKVNQGSVGITKQLATMTMGSAHANLSGTVTSTGPVDYAVVIAKTPHLKQTLNPQFPPIHVDVAECGGLSAKFLIEVYDWDRRCGHDLIGTVSVSMLDILYATRPQFLILNPSRVGDLTYRNSGMLYVQNVQHVLQPKVYADAYTITINCTDLDRKDLLVGGKSDPYLLIRGKPKPEASFPLHWDPHGEARLRIKDQERVQVYRTETHFNELKPQFTPFVLNVADCGGLDTSLEFLVFDYDQRGQDDLIGKFETTLREMLLVEPQFQVKNKDNTLISYSGICTVSNIIPCAPTFSVPPYAFKVKLRGVNIENKDLGGLVRSDPFLVIAAKPYGHQNFMRVYMSEVKHNTRTAEWGEFTMELAKYGGWDSEIRLEVWDYDNFNKNDFIGCAVTTIRELLSFKNIKPELKIFNPKKKGNLTYWDSGVIFIDYFDPLEAPPSYVVPRTFTAVNFNPTGFDDIFTTTMTHSMHAGYGMAPQPGMVVQQTSQPTFQTTHIQSQPGVIQHSQSAPVMSYGQPQPSVSMTSSYGVPQQVTQTTYAQPTNSPYGSQPGYTPQVQVQQQVSNPYGTQPGYGQPAYGVQQQVQQNPYATQSYAQPVQQVQVQQNPYATQQPIQQAYVQPQQQMNYGQPVYGTQVQQNPYATGYAQPQQGYGYPQGY